MTYVTGRLTAKNRDQFRNPTLGNRVWATFTLLVVAVKNPTLDIFAGISRTMERTLPFALQSSFHEC